MTMIHEYALSDSLFVMGKICFVSLELVSLSVETPIRILVLDLLKVNSISQTKQKRIV